MADKIRYRIPGKEQITKLGRVQKIVGAPEKNSFVFSTFNKDLVYAFVDESESTLERQFEDRPYVLKKEEYIVGAENFLEAMKAHRIKKAVYSRVKSVDFQESKADVLFDELCEMYPDAFCYLLKSEALGTWIGATPETLLAQAGVHGFAMALAGTVGVKDDGSPRSEWTTKEVEEHEYVADFIQNQLQKVDVNRINRSECYSHQAGQVCHLRTDFTFELNGKQGYNLAYQMHPTPAVCGVPTIGAMEVIMAGEHHNRELYTGFIGVVGEETSRYFVNLRCAKLINDKAYLYIGGGFTKESDPNKEWLETELKAGTLLHAMQKIS